MFGVSYGEDARVDTALRIAADHARATAFLIDDGVLPSNEGRGYVLRKIMRRAMRNVRLIGVQDPFLYQLTGFVAELMRPAYPELMESVPRIARVVKDEEHRYLTTFQVAEKVFHDEAKAAASGVLAGAVAFKLYDTYGLALDEQEEMAREYGLSIDREGFDREMEQQRERARASWKGAQQAQISPVYQDLAEKRRTRFVGYDALESSSSRVVALIADQSLVEEIGPGDKAELILDETPFYAEAGGQVGRLGELVFARDGPVGRACRDRLPGHRRAHRTSCSRGRAAAGRRQAAGGGRSGAAPGHHAQPHGHAPAARRAARGARRARQAGGQRGGSRAPALRLHALRRRGRGRTGRGRAAGQ